MFATSLAGTPRPWVSGFRFDFPERPGGAGAILRVMNDDWNITLFHYRNHGSDIGRVLAGIQVPERDAPELERFLNRMVGLGYAWMKRRKTSHTASSGPQSGLKSGVPGAVQCRGMGRPWFHQKLQRTYNLQKSQKKAPVRCKFDRGVANYASLFYSGSMHAGRQALTQNRRRGRTKVMVIDGPSDSSQRRIFLLQAGCQVILAEDGFDALAKSPTIDLMSSSSIS